MDLREFKDLTSPLGQRALSAAQELAPREQDYLTHFQHLTREYAPDLARAALEIAILRGAADRKFPFADRLFATRDALEQASGWEVSTYRAERFREFDTIVDLGCSIGSDTLAFSDHAPAVGIDIDPLRLAMARENFRAIRPSAQVALMQADLRYSIPIWTVPFPCALFFDPSRRVEHRRVHSVHDYTPQLSIIDDWRPRYPALGVKVSPGVSLAELQGYDAEVEFISHHGSLKEAVLWFGPLKRCSRRAAILPGPHFLESDLPEDVLRKRKLPLSQPLAYLYEPDPAVLRAGLVYDLGERINAYQLDPDIAYLVSDQKVVTPFARAWMVEDWMPFGLKKLRAYLREREVGRVIVKKRGSPLQPEELIQKLKLKGHDKRVVFLTHLQGRPIVVICYPAA